MLSAVHQAITYHMTLILTFHRIHSEASDVPGYPLALFKQVVNGVKKSGIKVLTLSQLDESNGIPVNNHIYYTPALPPQITVHVEASSSARPEGLWARVRWLVVIFVFILFIIVLVLAWWTSSRGAPTTGNTSAAHDSCQPGLVDVPAHVTDRYDRQVLSLHPVLYLTLGGFVREWLQRHLHAVHAASPGHPASERRSGDCFRWHQPICPGSFIQATVDNEYRLPHG
jgi:hypothetical protein